ncbi:peroxisomal membrane 11A isoform A [Chlorella sorokiniana]|uniref:Peroxisomal membrane 11A isoform A n=1 Tax=Chlorella sorokiniana TaxID=3076 RepID=A0A2P6TP86_CHLSO|nr:peroxisomal membrane 11A isoform A [Chlorella sorokiniana]|eukprot:PRW51151.1 peroxisomal membrane 11A isoform A [Chlorella sorokiniana]
MPGSAVAPGRRRLTPPGAAAAAALLLLALAVGCAPRPATAAVKPSDGGEQGGQLELQFAANKNREGAPIGTVTKAEVAGRTVYYEIPQAPKGTVAFFHGCSHGGYDSWYSQAACPECRGLPEEVSHTKQALALGYAVVAINSLNRDPPGEGDDAAMCFSFSDDKDGVAEALRDLLQEQGLQDLPLYVGGVSSGGSFALKLNKEMQGEIKGAFSEVLSMDPDNDDGTDWGSYPPVAFVRMERDENTNDRIARNQEVLQENGVPSQILVSPERRIYPTFFSDRASDFTPDLSERVTAALKEIGVIDADGNILAEPRRGFDFDWRAQLRAKIPEFDEEKPADSVKQDASVVSELLNMAWSNHEISGDYMSAILVWLEGGGQEDLQEIAQEWAIAKPALLTGTRLQPGQKPPTAGEPALGEPGGADVLDTTVAFLAKRDGIDKTLKIIRYTTRLLLATSFGGSQTDLAQRLKRFEASIGTSRKAYRLGKFLGDVNTLRKTRLHAPYAALEWVAAGGECVYYFVDQLIWLVKAGLLPERFAPRLNKVSNWGELIGYVGSISLSVLRISLLLEREVALIAELQRLQTEAAAAAGATAAATAGAAAAAGGGGGGMSSLAAAYAPAAAAAAAAAAGLDPDVAAALKGLRTEIRLLRARRVLRTLGLVQDLADLLMVLAEVRPSKTGLLSRPAVLALAGLLSGCLSAYKNWPGH